MTFLSRYKFLLLALAALLATAGLFAHWAWRGAAARRAPAQIAEALRLAGWRVELGAVGVTGAPNRLDLRIETPALESADGAWGWLTPVLETRAVIWRRDYLALHAPAPQALATPLGALLVIAPETAASLSFERDRLARLSLDLPAPGIERPNGAGVTLGRAQLHLRPDPEHDGAYQLNIRMDGLPDGAGLTLNGRAAFDAPLGRTPESWSAPTRLTLAPGATLSWPDATLTLRGSLERRADGWRGLPLFESDQARLVIDRLEALGLLTAEAATALRGRVSEAGRLAAVLAVEPGALIVRDAAPFDIPLWRAQRQ